MLIPDNVVTIHKQIDIHAWTFFIGFTIDNKYVAWNMYNHKVTSGEWDDPVEAIGYLLIRYYSETIDKPARG